MRKISIYIHIPFCIRKCLYCDFLSAPSTPDCIEQYVRALEAEIRFSPDLNGLTAAEIPDDPEIQVDTVFLGGGTPSLLTPDQLERILTAVRESYRVQDGAEISMEVNPGTADLDKLRDFRAAGINRLSIGVQSVDDAELALLGRIHRAGQAEKIFREARQAGFDNINIDLMSALPGQTADKWEQNLRIVCEWGPEHISAYSLIIEEGTPFAEMDLPPLPSEEEDRLMYHRTQTVLAEYSYQRYEISNYARPGRACRHNCGYWTGHEYLGLGLGASSLIGDRRFKVTASMPEYLRRIRLADSGEIKDPAHYYEEIQQLTLRDRMEEFMFLGLRMTEGVSEAEFRRRFGNPVDAVYGPLLARHTDGGLLERTGDRIRLTEKGLDLANYVMSDFILD
jgi:oxygen-independent coproporphyrinogen-3 oxidase